MNCQELLRAINEYVDGEIDPSICAQLEQHMRGCDGCRIFVDSVKKTVTLFKGEQVFEIPIEVKQRLDQSLRAIWDRGTSTGREDAPSAR